LSLTARVNGAPVQCAITAAAREDHFGAHSDMFRFMRNDVHSARRADDDQREADGEANRGRGNAWGHCLAAGRADRRGAIAPQGPRDPVPDRLTERSS
jgi:hypothetical protein